MKSRRSGFTLIELLVVIAIIGILATFLAPSLLSAKEKANKQKCANNIKGAGIAFILYSNDYRFFPHMTALDQEHTEEMISAVYRTLIYFKYIDTAEAYICPSSEDFYIQPTNEVIDNPKRFVWNAGAQNDSGQGSGNQKPILNAGGDPAVIANTQLSYTYLKRKVNASSARSDTLIGADKEIRELADFSDTGQAGTASSPSAGNHTDGFNICYADGHVNFVPTAEGGTMNRMHLRLQFNSTRFDQIKDQLSGE